MTLVIERPHTQYGSVRFVRSGVDVDKSSMSELKNTEVVNMQLYGVLLGYSEADDDGELVESWSDSSQLSLIHDAMLLSSFNYSR